jgi:Rps23 Pro-64 3,4-dihydroxylase Tpa1-like proline 4-hydroxylase
MNKIDINNASVTENVENVIKLEKKYLEETCKTSVLQFFGNWAQNIETLQEEYSKAKPFEHVIIDDFLDATYAEKIFQRFPDINDAWHEYKNPIEVKYTYDNINDLSIEIKNYFYYLSHPEMIQMMQKITSINDLEYDEFLHGAGVHMHPRYGRLNIHLDYEKHPYSGKERRLNIILFMSKEWNPDWNGANELWNDDVSRCITKTNVKFNRAIIFKTNNISWHGLPDKILCPENTFRKSLAYYYVSPLNTQKNESDYRKKAKFIKRPQDPYNENIQKLYEIRPNRRINKNDMETIIPDWVIEN